ncbi:MAG: hypothetical protein MRY74_06040 [Neomegalonema sp.]|nr:hypothetical protein [Neomegalonema sp.]
MSDDAKPMTVDEIERLIAEEKRAGTGKLDLHGARLTDLPASLATLDQLRSLQLGEKWVSPSTYVDEPAEEKPEETLVPDLSALAGLTGLRELKIVYAPLASFRGIEALTALEALACRSAPISDLEPLRALTQLQKLELKRLPATSIAPLGALSQLESVLIEEMEIKDISPLAQLKRLKRLNLQSMPLKDLTPLENMTQLDALHLESMTPDDLEPIAKLVDLKEIGLRSIGWGKNGWDDEDDDYATSFYVPISRLNKLQHINLYDNYASEDPHFEDLPELISYDSFNSGVLNMDSIKNAKSLEYLCMTPDYGEYLEDLTDISALSGKTKLRELTISYSCVTSLDALQDAQALENLDCSYTEISDLSPLRHCSRLKDLDVSHCGIKTLEPLSNLTNLAEIDCSATGITSLKGIENCKNISKITADGVNLNNHSEISNHTNLEHLSIEYSNITNIDFIDKLPKLRILTINRTKVTDLTPALNHPNICILNAGECNLEKLPTDPACYEGRRISLFESTVKGVPQELIDSASRDHSPVLRAHFQDLADGGAARLPSKLLILGNGGVGKTQLRRALNGQQFDPSVPTTHGVDVTPLILDEGLDSDALELSSWDFGGQDIYLGAHALFTSRRAIVALCWNPEFEYGVEKGPNELEFERRSLRYWLDYIRHRCGDEGALIAVETRNADRPPSPPPAEAQTALKRFRRHETVAFSAEPARGCAETTDALRRADEKLRARYGDMLLGRGRLEVMRRLIALRQTRPTLPFAEYEALCAEIGDVSDPAALAHFLDAAGVILYRKGHFDNQLILDQSSALEAVYAIYDRDRFAPLLLAQGGRFTPRQLSAEIWAEYDAPTRDLFLSFMQMMGVAFPIAHLGAAQADDLWIAPDFLPATPDDRIEALWPKEGQETVVETYQLDFLERTQIRHMVFDSVFKDVKIVYWRDGACFYAAETDATIRIEAVRQPEEDAPFGGEIVVSTRGSGASDAQKLFAERIKTLRGDVRLVDQTTAGHIQHPFRTGPAPGSLALSSTDGTERLCESETRSALEAPATALIQRAAAAKRPLLRMTAPLDAPDALLRQIENLLSAERVLLILSETYLRDRRRMAELFAIWRRFKMDYGVKQRLCVLHATPLAIETEEERRKYAQFWAGQATDAAQDAQESRTYFPYSVKALADHVEEILRFVAEVAPTAKNLDMMINDIGG